MRIVLIRHGDPDYELDSLTEKGFREGQALADHTEIYGDLGDCFVSPMGRAQRTAAPTLKKLGKTAETLPWAEEFHAYLEVKKHPDMWEAYGESPDDPRFAKRIVWDMLPSYFLKHPELLDRNLWHTHVLSQYTDMNERYERVTGAFDALLARYGYVRDGLGYRVERESHQTVTLFCHHGVTCVFLSHLLGTSPFVLWQGAAMPPTGVTELFSEEREKGLAVFRLRRFGDFSHLTLAGQQPSFAARFAETFSDDTRH